MRRLMASSSVCFICIGLAIFVGSAQAQDTASGEYFLGSCQVTMRLLDNQDAPTNKYETWRDGYCRGVIEGMTATSPRICPSESVTYGQEIRVVVKFMQDHPEKLNLRGIQLANDALSNAFPCSK
jgi:hypothetical protein